MESWESSGTEPKLIIKNSRVPKSAEFLLQAGLLYQDQGPGWEILGTSECNRDDRDVWVDEIKNLEFLYAAKH